MKTKNFMLTIIGMFALVLVMGLGSAVVSENNVSINFNQTTINDVSVGEVYAIQITVENLNASNFNVTLTNSNWDFSPVFQTINSGSTGSFVGIYTITSASSSTVTARIYDVSDPLTELFTIDRVLTINHASSGAPPTENITAFCEYGAFITDEDGNLESDTDKIEMKVDIKNEGEGEDDEWNALDTITIEVELENNYDEDDDMDMDDVTLLLGIYGEDDTTFDNNLAEDLIWISDDEEEADLGDLDAEEELSYTFEFRVNPEEFEEGEYIIVLKAYNDEETDSESSFCLDYSEDLEKDYYEKISVEAADDDMAVIVDVGSLNLLEASCEGTLIIDAEVWNVGDKEYEDYILVNLYNTELGIDLWQLIEDDLDVGDAEIVAFNVEIPAGLEEKTYSLHFKTYYDYDEDEDEYKTKSYDEESDDTFDVYLKVSGNCEVAKAQLSASLAEGGKAGESMVVKSTIVNSGSQTTTYNLNVASYAEWASSATLDATQITLGAGETKEVAITLDVKKDVSGDKIFNLEVVSDGQLVATQPVQVSVEPKSALSLSNGGMASILIGAISIILVIIIIVLAVKVARK